MMQNPKKILIVQTAFIGDVILATSLIESLAAEGYGFVDIIIRKGNETLLDNNPHINKRIIWNKKQNKTANLLKIITHIRKEKYDSIINIQRFGSTGLLTALSGARIKSGFKKNPFSFAFNYKTEHEIDLNSNKHEIDRNHLLIKHLVRSEKPLKPKLYPTENDYKFIADYILKPFIVIAPGSVWFTKQIPINQWINLLKSIPENLNIVFIGSENDINIAKKIILDSGNKNCINLCGQLSFMQSAALMEKAERCIVNDSAPLHIASAMNAKTTAVFCSTVPEFGFGPLADDSKIVEIKEPIPCRPCGLHGKNNCPLGHFDCGNKIKISEIINTLGKEYN